MLYGTADSNLDRRWSRAAAVVVGVVIASWQSAGFAATYYVAPTGGSDLNAGSLGVPFSTISHAIGVAASGDTQRMRGNGAIENIYLKKVTEQLKGTM